MAVTLRQLTGGTVAIAVWQLSDGTVRTVKLTQAEYDEFALTRKGVGDAPGRPTSDAVFIMAGGGIPAIDTVDGWPSVEDAWEVVEPGEGKRLVVATGTGVDFRYEQVIAAPPINSRSKTTGLRIRSAGNRQVVRTYNLNRLDRVTLTETPILTREELSGEIDNHRSVTFDATSSATIQSATSVTFAHTVAAQSNVYLACGGSNRAGSVPTSVTYNGTSLTKRGEIISRAAVTYWDLVAPDTGASHTVVYTANEAGGGGVAGVWSAYGVNQTTPRSDLQTASGNSGSPAVTVSSATGELVLSIVGFDANGGAITVDATFTQDWSLEPTSGNDRGGAGAHKAGAASVTRTDSLSGTDLRWAALGVAVKASTVAAVLQASASASGTATAALTTAIRCKASAVASAIVTAALTTGIRLRAAMQATGQAAAALTTAIRAKVDALASAVASASLTTAIRCAAQASASATTAAALTTAIALAASASAAAASTAALTTSIRMQTAAQGEGTAAASLTTAIRLQASAQATGSVTAALTAGTGALQVSATASAVASATLTTAIQFSASAAGTGSASAALTTSIRLAASPTGTGAAQASLTTSIHLQAASAGTASTTALLTTAVQMHAVASAAGSVSASLGTAIRLAAVASASATVTAELSAGVVPDWLELVDVGVSHSTIAQVAVARSSLRNASVSTSTITAVSVRHSTIANVVVLGGHQP
jgi:hypothetical protein